MTNGLDRRDFLRLGGLAGLSLAFPSGLGAWFAADRGRTADRRPTLVLVELTGGNDGLNTIVPSGDDLYHRARPTLRIAPSRVHKIDEVTGFAPELKRIAGLFKDGGFTIVQGVGMPNPDRSHFTSLDRWHTGRIAEPSEVGGWVGRGLERVAAPAAGLAGVALGERVMPRLLQHHERQALCCETIAELVPPAEARRVLLSGAFSVLDSIAGSAEDQRLAASARDLLDRLEGVLRRSIDADAFPPTHAGRLFGDALRLVMADLAIPAIFIRQGGFDTHVRQAQVQPQLLAEIDGGLAAFAAALTKRGLAGSVLVIVYSEFGRRVAENGSRGTDHGSGAPVLMWGGGLPGGLVGDRPDLGRLDDGDVRATIDFRRVLAQGLKHLGHPDPASVLGAGIKPLV